MLCGICTDILEGRTAPIVPQNPENRPREFPYRRTAHSLRESARDNCFICRRVWSQLVSLVPGGSLAQKSRAIIQWLESRRLYLSSWRDDYGTKLFQIQPALPDDPQDIELFLLQPLSSYERQPETSKASLDARSPLPTNFPPISETSSKESMDQARMWLRQCVSSHSKCNQFVNSNWFPTRVLEVGKDPSTPSLRLICTAEEPLSGRYVTLSHCWGKHEFIKLLKSNIEEFRRNISFSDLPKTFCDVIMVIQGFGIRYIWIDSLCILQDKDDLTDWHKEAALMQQVYSCSYLNIAASAAADGSEGLFRARDLSTLQPEIVQYRDLSRSKETEPISCILISAQWWTELESTPLNKRGWVFQERLLAPRVLHFGHSELAWECCEFEASETFPGGVPGSVLSFPYVGKTTKSSFFNVDQTSGHQGAELWRRIVFCYSRTAVTFSADKLVALSGVAKRFRELIPDEYIAGMWRKDLERQLTWSTRASAAPLLSKDRNSLHYCYPSPYRAPTWSWASVDTIIVPMLASDRDDFLFVVEDVQLIHVTDDTTGAISSGHIDLKGTLLPFDVDGISIVTFEPDYGILSGGYLLSSMAPGADLEHSVVSDTNNVADSDRASEAMRVWYSGCSVMLDDPSLSYDNDKVWCLLGTRIDRSDDPFLTLVVLLLEEVDGQHGIFRRIGIAMKSSPYRSDRDLWTEHGWWNDVRVDEMAAKRFPCRKYIEEEGKHVVRVI